MKYLGLVVMLITGGAVAAQDAALDRLEKSPRHHEWVQIANGDRTVHSFVVYPERSDDAQAIIVIHENRGLTDWVRSMADQLAEAGYLAIAPDLLSDFNENYSKTTAFPSSDEARNAIYQLDPDQVAGDLNAVFDFVKTLPGASDQVSVIGFCWGGSQTFRMATYNPDLKAALVFYGTGPKGADAIARIEAPVYGFYGEDDQRVNATIADSEEMMEQAGKSYEYVIYPGSGHAYMRRADDPSESQAQRDAHSASMIRIQEILRE